MNSIYKEAMEFRRGTCIIDPPAIISKILNYHNDISQKKLYYYKRNCRHKQSYRSRDGVG
jgi:hypothetical protein